MELLEEMLKQLDQQFFPPLRKRVDRFVDILNHDVTQSKLMDYKNDLLRHLSNIEQSSSVFQLMQALRYFVDDTNRLGITSIIQALQQSGLESLMTDNALDFLDTDHLSVDERVEKFFNYDKTPSISNELTPLALAVIADIRQAFDRMKQELSLMPASSDLTFTIHEDFDEKYFCKGCSKKLEDSMSYLTHYVTCQNASAYDLQHLIATEWLERNYSSFQKCMSKLMLEVATKYCCGERAHDHIGVTKQLQNKLSRPHEETSTLLKKRRARFFGIFKHTSIQEKFIEYHNNLQSHQNIIDKRPSVFQLMQALRYFVDDLNDFGKNPMFKIFLQPGPESLMINDKIDFLDDDRMTLDQRVDTIMKYRQSQSTPKVIVDLKSEIVSDIRKAFEPLKEKLVSMQKYDKHTLGLMNLVGIAMKKTVADGRLSRGRPNWYEDTAKILVNYVKQHYLNEDVLESLHNSQFEKEFIHFRTYMAHCAHQMRVKYCLLNESPTLTAKLFKETFLQYSSEYSQRIKNCTDRLIPVLNHHTAQNKFADCRNNFLHCLDDIEHCTNLSQLINALSYFIKNTHSLDINCMLQLLQQLELENTMTIGERNTLDGDQSSVSEVSQKVIDHCNKLLVSNSTIDRMNLYVYVSNIQQVLRPLRLKTPFSSQTSWVSANAISYGKYRCRVCQKSLENTSDYLTHYITSHDTFDELQRGLDSFQIENSFSDFHLPIEAFTNKMRMIYCLDYMNPNLITKLMKTAFEQYNLEYYYRIQKRINRLIDILNHSIIQRKLMGYSNDFKHHLDNIERCSNTLEMMKALRLFASDIDRFDINCILESTRPDGLEKIMTSNTIDFLDDDNLIVDERVKQFFRSRSILPTFDLSTDPKSEIESQIVQTLKQAPGNFEKVLKMIDSGSSVFSHIQHKLMHIDGNKQLCPNCLERFRNNMNYLTNYVTCHNVTDDELQTHLKSEQLEIHFQQLHACVMGLISELHDKYCLTNVGRNHIKEQLEIISKRLEQSSVECSQKFHKRKNGFINVFNHDIVQRKLDEYSRALTHHMESIQRSSRNFEIIRTLRNFVEEINHSEMLSLLESVQESGLECILTTDAIDFLDNDHLSIYERVEQYFYQCQTRFTQIQIDKHKANMKSKIQESLKQLQQKLVPKIESHSRVLEDTMVYLNHYIVCPNVTDGELKSRLDVVHFKNTFPYFQEQMTRWSSRMRMKYCLYSQLVKQFAIMETWTNIFAQNERVFSPTLHKRIDRFVEILNHHTVQSKLNDYRSIFLRHLDNIEHCSDLFQLMQGLHHFIEDTNRLGNNMIIKLLQESGLKNLMSEDVFDLDDHSFSIDEGVEQTLRDSARSGSSNQFSDITSEIIADIRGIFEEIKNKLENLREINGETQSTSSLGTLFNMNIRDENWRFGNTVKSMIEYVTHQRDCGNELQYCLKKEAVKILPYLRAYILDIKRTACRKDLLYKLCTIQVGVENQWKTTFASDHIELPLELTKPDDTFMNVIRHIRMEEHGAEDRSYHTSYLDVNYMYSSISESLKILRDLSLGKNHFNCGPITRTWPRKESQNIVTDTIVNDSTRDHLYISERISDHNKEQSASVYITLSASDIVSDIRQAFEKLKKNLTIMQPVNIMADGIINAAIHLNNDSHLSADRLKWFEKTLNYLERYVLRRYVDNKELSEFLHQERLENDVEHFKECTKGWLQKAQEKLISNGNFLVPKPVVMAELERIRIFLHAVILNKQELRDEHDNSLGNVIRNATEQVSSTNGPSLLPCISFGQLPLPENGQRIVRFTFVLNSSPEHLNAEFVLKDICNMFENVRSSQFEVDQHTRKIELDIKIAGNIPHLLGKIISKLANLNVRSVLIGDFGIKGFRHAMNPAFNRIYSRDGKDIASGFKQTAFSCSIDRGGEPYYCPVGWRRYGLDVGMTDEQFEKEYGQWPIAYHGTAGSLAMVILLNGLRASGHGCFLKPNQGAVYLSPSIEYSGHPRYAKVLKVKSKYVQMILQVRVQRKKIEKHEGTLFGAMPHDRERADPNFSNNELEWIVRWNSGENIGVLDGILVYGLMFRVTDEDPGLLPQNQWWHTKPPWWWNFLN